jgi:hypothetical protein
MQDENAGVPLGIGGTNEISTMVLPCGEGNTYSVLSFVVWRDLFRQSVVRP